MTRHKFTEMTQHLWEGYLGAEPFEDGTRPLHYTTASERRLAELMLILSRDGLDGVIFISGAEGPGQSYEFAIFRDDEARSSAIRDHEVLQGAWCAWADAIIREAPSTDAMLAALRTQFDIEQTI